MKNIGLVFSKPLDFGDPLGVMGVKRPVYEELWQRCRDKNLNLVLVSTRGYLGNGNFSWFWEILPGKTKLIQSPVKIDLAYDRSGGLTFPLNGDRLRVVDCLEFKKLAWDKWQTYQLLGDLMPKTVLMEDVAKIAGDWVVLKPVDGLKGKGIYIGPKKDIFKFTPLAGRKYLAQEFLDTSGGIKGITSRIHDLRLVVVNAKIVWSHLRTPPAGQFKANVAGGGELKEVETRLIPAQIREIAGKVADLFYRRFDNPIFSLDFGVGKDGRAFIFEINDQIGFPRPEMTVKDRFLEELVANFAGKI